MPKATIAQIVPYFGRWPEWIDLYLFSCGQNPQVDFIFFTDCPIPAVTYPNTIFHPMTFSEYCDLVSERLHINFHPERAYKLCDLRPFYGVIHQEELRDYEFWGYGDIDLVYADLSCLLTPRRLKRCDLITTHINRVAGHFTVIRRDSPTSTACFNIPNWQEHLEAKENRGMDEARFSNVVMPLRERMIRALRGRLRSRLPHFDSYRFDRLMHRLLPPTNRRICMVESLTTFVPPPSYIYEYQAVTLRIVAHRALDTKLPKGLTLPYLHFLFFKKTPYLQTEHYWRDGFYQIPADFDFRSGNFTLEISSEFIRLKPQQP
jgi:hypothetical protein